MPEKLYGFTHLISETKLLALIASHADEVQVEIFEKRPPKTNGHLSHTREERPLMLEVGAPVNKMKKPKNGWETKPKAKRRTTKMSAAKFILAHLYENRDGGPVTLQEIATAAKPYKIPVARISTSITPAIQRGAIKRVDKGSYKIARAGIAEVENERASSAFMNHMREEAKHNHPQPAEETNP